MTGFRVFLVFFWLVLLAYTGIVIGREGVNLLPIFFGDMGKLMWPGQFNLDFFGLLLLSGLWTAWRSGFSISGLLLGLVALVGGVVFLFPYLTLLSFRANGDIRKVMLGIHASDDRPT